MAFSSAEEVLAFIAEEKVEFIDLRFMDFPGAVQHFTIPVEALDEDVFEEGSASTARRIRGWQAINESDMLRGPAAGDGRASTRSASTTLTMICNIQDPITERGLQPRPAQHRPQGRATT